MTPTDTDDPILRLVTRLPAAEPDAARSQRVVTRCHAAMAKRQVRSRRRRGFARRVLEPAVVGAFSLVYVVALVHHVLRWRGVL